MRDAVDRYVNACRMAANESVRLYMNHGEISIDRVTQLVKDVCELTRMVQDLTQGERAMLNQLLDEKRELSKVFADVMVLRGRNAALRSPDNAPAAFEFDKDGGM